MNSDSRIVRDSATVVFIAAGLIAFSLGCGSGDKGTDNGTDPVVYSPSVDEDVATSLAAILATENGGVSDQLVDIVSLAGPYGLRDTSLVANQTSPSYDLSTRTWQWDFAREYSSANGLYFARVERTYQWRFLKKNGQPQVTYIFANDTAYTIELTIVSGSGRHLMPFLSQTLDSLSGRLVATGTNTDDMTVTGAWYRSALDTIRTRYAVRTLAHECSLAISNIHCQRDTTSQPWRSISGTITGTFSADITFASGDAYAEDSVTRAISIVLDSGNATISMIDTTWTSDLRRGDLR